MGCNYICYHDVDVIRLPQPRRLLELGHVLGQRFLSTTWVGRVSSTGKIAFIKSVKIWKILLDI